MINCLECYSEIQYDEGIGNIEDGYTCYLCLENLKKDKDKLINETEKLLKGIGRKLQKLEKKHGKRN